MKTLLIVGAGGFIGAILRYLMNQVVNAWFPSLTLPLGTLFVNVIGCFLIGALGYLAETNAGFSPQLQALMIIGVLGAFTTFSTFGNETFALFSEGFNLAAMVNISVQVILGLLAVWGGRSLAAAWI